MEPLQVGEIRVSERYEQERDAARLEQVALRLHRRVVLDDTVALLFENRETVRAALEELARAENVRDAADLTAELEGFNELLPHEGELAATLCLQASDTAALTAVAARLAGLEASIALTVAGARSGALALHGTPQAAPGVIAHLRFPLSMEQRQAWRQGEPVVVLAEHDSLGAQVTLTAEQQAAIGQDL